LSLVAGFVHKVAGNDDKRGTEPIDRCDGELEIRGFLRKIPVIGEHAELRITELNEEEGFRRGRGRGRQPKQQSDSQAPGQSRHPLIHIGMEFCPKFLIQGRPKRCKLALPSNPCGSNSRSISGGGSA
jgi:hypothetical protein